MKMSEMKPSRQTEELINRYYTHLQKDAKSVQNRFPLLESFDHDGLYRRIEQQMPSDTQTRLRSRWYAAAAIIVLLIVSFLGYNNRSALFKLTEKTIIERSTVNGEIAQINLNDGTKIWLNSGSKLVYPETFSDTQRSVTLIGEAYFEVAPDARKPFIIHCGNLTTKVVGTSLNIKAYEEGREITVAVISGKVEVLDNGKLDETVSLLPNQIAVYNKSNSVLVRQEAGTSALPSWKEGKMSYKSTPLREVVADVQRRYNVKIQIDTDIQDCAVSVDFSTASLDKVLKVLAELINGEAFHKADTYFLKGKGC